ncbi:N-(5'-phosphoribosyl)anthranilate isomerase [Yeosuana aromativorans]|uniref:N-(5'-phosphoribosyl)anthranilate isomerase n=1 Tax=Yeosuana aromativorans TaxID=288019 RepID=A0A8J3BJL5_9FLAO|nr:phosphoribosylanthranilate isomerase [Yeosuana aromativorans]GGK25816.1 N-(5'-phosphoribosyl)anthranilate isomerase [Yeosuana aromativorans]
MKLKVCGMKYLDNIEQVAALHPDYLGFIFYEKSARYFDGEIPKISKSIKKVGVFVNAEINDILEKINAYHLQVVQLHGHESPEYCEKLKRHYEEGNDEVIPSKDTDCFNSKKESRNDNQLEIIKVFSIKDHFNFDLLEPYESVCDYFLFDTKGKLPGGNGYTFDWTILNKYPSNKPFFLSGGIGLEALENIIQFQKNKASKYCFAIDVNSQFEIEPGLKDIEKLKEFKSQL